MAVYKRDMVDINLETGNIHRSFLKHSIGYKDAAADHFGIRVFRNGEPVSLTGVSVQGIFMPPQGDPIAITSGNIVSENEAEVVLPQACYNYDGQFTLAIKLVDATNAVTGTMRIVDGMVDNTHASGTVAPTAAVPTYQEILATYEAMLAATTAATTAATNVGSIVAAAYSTSATYAVGDYCTKDGNLYRCTTAITTAESWTAAHWTQTKMGPDVSDLKSALDLYVNQYANESYSNALPVARTSVSVPTGNGQIVIPNDTSLVKTFEAGKKYFAYAEITISNLSGYSAGYMYLKWSYTVNEPTITDFYAGTNAQTIKNGKIKLYGFFTSVSGQGRPTLSCTNTSAAYSLDVSLDKIFLIETEEDLSSLLANINNSNNVYVPCLPEKCVLYDSLSDELKRKIPSDESTIIDCWGDSLTQGAGSTSYPYPTKLQALVGNSYTVNNYGQGSENAEAIAFRQGGLPAIVDPFNISSGTTVTITGKFINGQDFGNLNISGLYNGDNRVYIDNNPFMFRRAGNDTFYVGLQGDTSSTHGYSRPQLMVAEGKGTNHIIIICIGQNGWKGSEPETLADIINLMITHNNSLDYLVLGRPTGNAESRATEECVLADRFGEHFVNTREYISAYGLSDNPSITPTPEDETAMSTGAIPPSLKSDGTHMNDYGYIAMANCIYQRGKTLKYW